MRLLRAPGALCARSCASCCRLARCAARQPTHAAPRVRRAHPCLATGSGEGGNNADSSSSSGGPDSAGKQGNADVQDALADILDMEIRKSKVKQVRHHACRGHAWTRGSGRCGTMHERIMHSACGIHDGDAWGRANDNGVFPHVCMKVNSTCATKAALARLVDLNKP